MSFFINYKVQRLVRKAVEARLMSKGDGEIWFCDVGLIGEFLSLELQRLGFNVREQTHRAGDTDMIVTWQAKQQADVVTPQIDSAWYPSHVTIVGTVGDILRIGRDEPKK